MNESKITDEHAQHLIDNLITKERWIALAGLKQIQPALEEETVQICVIAFLWNVKFSDGEEMHIISSDGDISSLMVAINKQYNVSCDTIVSLTRIGSVKGTATLSDVKFAMKLKQLQATEQCCDSNQKNAASSEQANNAECNDVTRAI